MKVSIITAFYRGEEYIQGLLQMVGENARACSEKDIDAEIEYIIVNDSPEVKIHVEGHSLQGYEVKVLTNECNSGIHQSRVKGLMAARGEYVLFLDQDDILLPKAIYTCLQEIADADMIICNGYHNEQGKRTPIYKSHIAQWAATKKIFSEFCTGMCVSPGHVLLRKESIPQEWQTNIMQISGSDDYFLWLLMLDKKRKIVTSEQYIYEHVATGNNLSKDRKRMYASSYSFCEMAGKSKLVTDKMARRIMRRIKLKRSWHFDSKSFLKRMSLIVRNIDIFAMNAIHKLLF